MQLRWWNPLHLCTSSRSKGRLWFLLHHTDSSLLEPPYTHGGYCYPARLWNDTCRMNLRPFFQEKCSWNLSKILFSPLSWSYLALKSPDTDQGIFLVLCLLWVSLRIFICYTAPTVSWQLQSQKKCVHTRSS